jgi:halimadienyl-diphosphate synthase
MVTPVRTDDTRELIATQVEGIIDSLGQGRVDGVAYDTAWVARLAPRYPGYGFENCLDWLRRNQHKDGTWGAPLVHYHDRFISTLAAIVALREAGNGKRDERRVKRGEQALWHLVGKLNRDDSDTIGFPILSAALARDAEDLGLDVPTPPTRFAMAYNKKVDALIDQPVRHWRGSPLAYSMEGLRYAVGSHDEVLEANGSVSTSPAATAGYLLSHKNDLSLQYLVNGLDTNGSVPAFDYVDVFDIAWSINFLAAAKLIHPSDKRIRRALDHLWKAWSPESGASPCADFQIPDVDTTAAAFLALHWGGYPVNAYAFGYFELENHFCCYHNETNPSLSANVRLLAALRVAENHPMQEQWTKKIVSFLRLSDENGSFWWDKWHASPYYATSIALSGLRGVADDLAISRMKWILHTQNSDGGWGYLEQSTPEETAYCINALVNWDLESGDVESSAIQRANTYLQNHISSSSFTPLWIGKSLYTPKNPVKSLVISAYFRSYGYAQ